MEREREKKRKKYKNFNKKYKHTGVLKKRKTHAHTINNPSQNLNQNGKTNRLPADLPDIILFCAYVL